MDTFKPHLHILPLAQQDLWQQLDHTPEHFTLYGGTAIALQLGHRQSIDFDFFSAESFDPLPLLQQIPYLKNAQPIQASANTLTCRVTNTEPVLISFFGNLHFPLLKPAMVAEGKKLKIASLLDLAGMKAALVQERVEIKDYLDMSALLESNCVTLAQALAAAKVLYGTAFNPHITLKALCYFEDGDLPLLPTKIKHQLCDATKKIDLNQLPNLHALP